MAAIVLIEPTTDAVPTEVRIRIQGRSRASIIAQGLAGSEVIPIFFTVDDGATFEQVQQDGSVVELTATDNVFAIEASMEIAVTKPVTAGQVGVFLSSDAQQ